MNKAIFRKRSIAVLVTTLATVGAVAAYTTATASAQGRTIEGNFCLGEHLFCMSAGLTDSRRTRAMASTVTEARARNLQRLPSRPLALSTVSRAVQAFSRSPRSAYTTTVAAAEASASASAVVAGARPRRLTTMTAAAPTTR